MIPKIELEPCGNLYKVVAVNRLEFQGIQSEVKEGFIYDGASIPKEFWMPIGSPYDPRFMRGAAHHDDAYTNKNQSREWADLMLLWILIEDGVAPVIAFEIYEAVHLFGGLHWNKKG